MTDFVQRAKASEAEMRALFEASPLQRNAHLSEMYDADIWLKREDLTPVRSYKIRGAFNAMRKCLVQTPDQQLFVAASAGNHAQGVAYAARLLGMQATIVMPSDAPEVKKKGTASLGATIRLYDRETEAREEIASDIASKTGAVLVPAFDDPELWRVRELVVLR